jgi:sarcosine oxidase gamma subunit
MRWAEVRAVYPDQWLVIEAHEAHTAGDRRIFDRIAVIDTCSNYAISSI